MNNYKGYRIFLILICTTLAHMVTIGNTQASQPKQAETDFAAIDTYVTEQMKNLDIPGLALGIVQDGKIAHLQGFGVADSSGRAVTPQTPFYLASISKSFTALAVMQLVETGEIDLDAPVQTYLPWFDLADKEASAKITVRNLLNHASGISNEDGDPNWISQQGLEEMVRGLDNLQLTQPIGAIFQYSSLNYDIAGLIVEQVSGQSYANYVIEHIFEPLDMRHSYASHAPALADGSAEGHRYMFGHTFRDGRPTPLAGVPGGGLIASVEDVTHYAIAQLNDGQYGDTSVLSPQGIAKMHTPAIATNGGDQQYAMGWFVSKLDGIPAVEHGGDLYNFHTQIFLLPENGVGVILLANAHGFEQLMQVPELSKCIVGMLNGKPASPVHQLFKVRFIYWTILLVPLLMILGIAYSWRYWRNKGTGHNIMVIVLYGGIALSWLFAIPLAIGYPFSLGNRIFYPELSYFWLAGVALGIGWSVIFTAMYLMKLNKNRLSRLSTR